VITKRSSFLVNSSKWYTNGIQPSLAVHGRRHMLQWHATKINFYWCLVNVMAIKQYQLTYLRGYWALLVLLVTRCIRRKRLWDTTKIWGRMFGLWDENENENLSNTKKQCNLYSLSGGGWGDRVTLKWHLIRSRLKKEIVHNAVHHHRFVIGICT